MTGLIAMQRLLIFTIVTLVSIGNVNAGAANDPLFSNFAKNIVGGLNAATLASLPANNGYGPPRIAVRTIYRDGKVTPDGKTTDFTRRMLVALHKHANGRFSFVALDALDSLIRDIKAEGLPIDESRARIRDLRANAHADILVAGIVGTDGGVSYLSYQAINTSTGELLANTSVEPVRPSITPSSTVPVQTAPVRDHHGPTVQEAEQLLFDRGYDPGPIDGYLTRKTREALRAYQKNSALPVNGRLTRRVVENLRRDSRTVTF